MIFIRSQKGDQRYSYPVARSKISAISLTAIVAVVSLTPSSSIVLQKEPAAATTQPFVVDAVHFFNLKIGKGA
jgi:hypothetical protein